MSACIPFSLLCAGEEKTLGKAIEGFPTHLFVASETLPKLKVSLYGTVVQKPPIDFSHQAKLGTVAKGHEPTHYNRRSHFLLSR